MRKHFFARMERGKVFKFSLRLATVMALLIFLLTSCGFSAENSEELKKDLQTLKDDVTDLGNSIYSAVKDSQTGQSSEGGPAEEGAGENRSAENISSNQSQEEPQPEETASKTVDRFWLEIRSDHNLFFSQYDVDVSLDGKLLDTIQNGKSYSAEFPIASGEHELSVCKSGNSGMCDTYNFSVSENSVFTAAVSHDSAGVKIHDAVFSVGMDKIEGIVPDVSGMLLEDAANLLKSEGFLNVVAYDGASELYSSRYKDYLVREQNAGAGTVWKRTDKIKLVCINHKEYYASLFSGKTFAEAKETARAEGIEYECYAAASRTLLQEPSENEEYWIVDQAEKGHLSNTSAALYLTYIGTPEEHASEEARLEAERQEAARLEAEKAVQAAAELEGEKATASTFDTDSPADSGASVILLSDPEQDELQTTLSAALPLETALEAIRVAFTNSEAMDVFTDDGIDYDPSRFHGSDYAGQYAFVVREGGTWSADSAWAWKADNILLVKPAFDRAARISCKVTCDGQNYIVYNVSYVTAKTEFVDSGDPSKTSGEMTMEPGADNAFLTIPLTLINTASVSDWSVEALSEDVNEGNVSEPAAEFTQLTYSDYKTSARRDWSHAYTKGDDTNVVGNGEGMTLSISADSKKYSLTPQDFLLFDYDDCFNVEYSGITDYNGTATLTFRLYCTASGEHVFEICSTYDYLTNPEDDSIYSSYLIKQLDEYDGQLVYTTPYGERRHLSEDCAGVNASPTTRYDARIWGYDSCGKCGG